ncbi:uncharacterized protein RCH25_004128 [Pelodytes ibericus]
MAAVGWSERMLQILLKMNGLQRDGCLPFCVQGQRVGWVVQSMGQLLAQFSDVFSLRCGSQLELTDRLQTPQERSVAVQEVMKTLRSREVLPCLEEWRDELYDVKMAFSDIPLFSMERAATPLLGVPRYGVHVNGFLQQGADVFMWLGRRSLSKATFPGMLDHLVAGGISAGMGVWETLLKECAEEASIPESLAATAKPAGTVSYGHRLHDAVYIECQFVFDLEVPPSFQPHVGDGEVQEFYLWPLNKVKEAISENSFKPNCALVILDFLLRHGHIDPDKERFYQQFLENLHGAV